MKSNLIKRITLIASVILTLSIFGITTPIERSVSAEPNREQIVMLFAGEPDEDGANISKRGAASVITDAELFVNVDKQVAKQAKRDAKGKKKQHVEDMM